MNSFFCFVHLEKTAGSTLHQLLLESFPRYLSIHPAYLPAHMRRAYLFDAQQLKIINRLFHPQGVGGHKIRSYLGYEEVLDRPIRYFTFLRDPVARYISHYQYQVGQRGLRDSFDEFLENEEACDLQCRRLCGSRSADKALAEIEKFAFVGLVEDFVHGLRLLSYHVFENQLRVRPMKRNTTNHTILPDFGEMEKRWRERILANNREDLNLCQAFKDTGYRKYSVEEEHLVEVSSESDTRISMADKVTKGIKRYGLEPLSLLLSKAL